MNTLRLGNVLGSQGSVVPLFQQQIASGGPVTVTHPDARRFFLTLDETVALITACSSLEDSGCIFIPKLNAPVKILDLALRMIREAGLVSPRDIQIVFTGLRPGDKLEEELVSAHERLESTALENLQVVKQLHPDLESLDVALCRISECVHTRNLARLLDELAKLVPEYNPSETILDLLNPQLA